jgi:hypothetical protein
MRDERHRRAGSASAGSELRFGVFRRLLGLLGLLAVLTAATVTAAEEVPLSWSYPSTDAYRSLPAAPDQPVGHDPYVTSWDVGQPHRIDARKLAGPSQQCEFSYGLLARGYYMNDQRIEWSGQEATFGVEAVLDGAITHSWGPWETGLTGQLFLNQPYDRNRLVAPAERSSYLGNFELDTVEISQLYVSLRRDDLLVDLGKFMTPFGRYHFPLYTNSLMDAPFIRSESINWFETGLLLQYDPEPLVFTVGIVNGCEDMDTNSSKAIISRIGCEFDTFAAGMSVKYQDGIGSEEQKTTNNHIGIDCMYRWGRWVVSGEAIYDEYGFRREFDPLEITWGRSIYYRDRYVPGRVPITGWGYYANLTYEGEDWTWVLNYGDYYPQQIGDRLHDTANHRGVIKAIRGFGDHLQAYSIVILENDVPEAQAGRLRKGWAVWLGFQYDL